MKKLHISKRTMIALGLLLFALSVSLTAGVYAKYISGRKFSHQPISSKNFYFTSNYLTEDNHEYKLNAGTQAVTIEIYNYDHDNELLVSEVDCTYYVTVTPRNADDDVEVNDTAINTATAGSKTAQTLTISGLDNGNSYKVEVRANGGYEKTLSATFTVAESPDGFFMNVNDTADYIVLTVWTENITGEVTVTFPAGLIPDATNPILSTVINYQSGTYNKESFTDAENFKSAYSSYSYRFFKTNGYTYTAGTISVTMGTKSAAEVNIP